MFVKTITPQFLMADFDGIFLIFTTSWLDFVKQLVDIEKYEDKEIRKINNFSEYSKFHII